MHSHPVSPPVQGTWTPHATAPPCQTLCHIKPEIKSLTPRARPTVFQSTWSVFTPDPLTRGSDVAVVPTPSPPSLAVRCVDSAPTLLSSLLCTHPYCLPMVPRCAETHRFCSPLLPTCPPAKTPTLSQSLVRCHLLHGGFPGPARLHIYLLSHTRAPFVLAH